MKKYNGGFEKKNELDVRNEFLLQGFNECSERMGDGSEAPK
jgi:hypothetical protein